MASSELKGKIQTVQGLIEPDELGITLMHEHLLTDLSVFFTEPEEATAREIAHQPLSLENLFYVRYNFFSNIDNLRYTDENLIIKEASRFKNAGGDSIVEMSNYGLFRDPRGLFRISRATGLNVIMGSGFYIEESQTDEARNYSMEKMAECIIHDITVGAEDTGIKAGIIGEIACNAPFTEFERRSLSAGAIAQNSTGAMINIHPSHKDDIVFENIKVVKDHGGDLQHVVISHVDGWQFTEEVINRILDLGCKVEYDHFGVEGYYPPYHGDHLNTPTDEDKIKSIQHFIDKGYINQILISSDHCQKFQLASYGGCGYDHILRNAVPLMKINGMTDEQINTILVENPQRILAFP